VTNVFYNEGEQHLLASYFQDEPVTFGPFYVGLGTGGAILNENISLSDLVEISDAGYARQVVNRDAGPNGWSLQSGFVESPVLEFTNTGQPCWAPADYVFLTLSPDGLNGDTTIIAATNFANSELLVSGKRLRIIFRFRARSGGLTHESNQQASAYLVSNALIFAEAVVI